VAQEIIYRVGALVMEEKTMPSVRRAQVLAQLIIISKVNV
jgi:hypothetical protein